MTREQDEYEARRDLEDARKAAKRARASIPKGRGCDVRAMPCRVCGSRCGTEVHHIVPRSHFVGGSGAGFDPHDPANLMSLCHRHHQDHHTQGRSGRVPRHRLNAEELAFALVVKHPSWVAKWYPERTA